ncbi:hypothetical protein [Marinomonas sp. BSi20584]|uniref:hypothetical protein n=1 Tax=Marinomonas sp. BSi20584 TaxID=1594462 RepID=UPI000C1EF4C3|nr:hypothetical protein [Marinomonas sp. BSi20584]PJE55656.1 hypothetical protein TY87_09370 [Marinomonas sp. BSi20584]
MNFENFHDDASKYIDQALSTVILISHESAFTNVNPKIIEQALWSVTESLTKLDQLFYSVLDDENSAARKP